MNSQDQTEASRPSHRRIEPLMLEDDYIDGVGGWPPPTPPAEKAASPRLAARPTMTLSFRFSDEAMNATSFRFLREAMGKVVSEGFGMRF